MTTKMTAAKKGKVEGMLWVDLTGRKLELRLVDAVAHYERRHGRRPTVVMLPINEERPDSWMGIALQSGKVQRAHMIVGEWL